MSLVHWRNSQIGQFDISFMFPFTLHSMRLHKHGIGWYVLPTRSRPEQVPCYYDRRIPSSDSPWSSSTNRLVCLAHKEVGQNKCPVTMIDGYRHLIVHDQVLQVGWYVLPTRSRPEQVPCYYDRRIPPSDSPWSSSTNNAHKKALLLQSGCMHKSFQRCTVSCHHR